jgi:hypothetical protein
MTLSNLPSPAEAFVHNEGPCTGFAQAGNRCTVFGIMLQHLATAFAAPSASGLARIGFPSGKPEMRDVDHRPDRSISAKVAFTEE